MASDFVERVLGFWSSHPANLKKQKALLLILGTLPIIATIVLCVLVYKDLFSWKDFVEQIGLLVGSAFFVLGFLITLIVLYLASFTIGSKKGKITNKDELVFPLWMLLVFCFFWLLPYLLSVLPDVKFSEKLVAQFPFLKFSFQKDINTVKAVLNMLAISPFLCLLTWILCAKEEELKENEKLVRRPMLLTLALFCVGMLGAAFFFPTYRDWDLRLCTWIVMIPFSLIFFSLWWFWRKKVAKNKEKDETKKEQPEPVDHLPILPQDGKVYLYRLKGGEVIKFKTSELSKDEAIGFELRVVQPAKAVNFEWSDEVQWEDGDPASAMTVADTEYRLKFSWDVHALFGGLFEDLSEPPQAKYIKEHLPDGITYEKDKKEAPPFSPLIPEDVTSYPLIALMGGKTPTEDQKSFLDRFRSLYEDTLNDFFESAKPNSEQILPDIILQGEEGSGRTEALCAAAVYAAVVRGQNVLYFAQDASYAKKLAEKMSSRLVSLFVDSYYTADYLKPNFVDTWLPAADEKNEGGASELPPNILFATPEQVEQSFFSNDSLVAPEKREALRNILLGYSVILVDDFLEMPIPLQAHLAFILDKFRLLQASEYVIGQFVIATAPLEEQYGLDGLAERMFGLSQFNVTKNAVLLHPRKYDPPWHGTLRIDPTKFESGKQLEKAAEELLKICTEQNYNTLFYSKGISRKDAEELEARYEKQGTVSVVSRLYQLNEDKMPFDTIFYLSLTSGNAAAALRLSLPDDKAGTPAFFRIALRDEVEKPVENQFALLPNETAISLRAYHLRSVLPFLPKLTPISASVWSHFGISLTHPFCRDAKIARMPDGLAVAWYHDYYAEPDRYGENVIWPYLVLASDPTISNIGQNIDFNFLPSTKDSIWRDRRLAGPDGGKGDALYFVSGERSADAEPTSQLAVWRDKRGNPMGTTDLAHADLLTLVTADNQFSAEGIQAVGKYELDASRYAMIVTAQPRKGALSYDIPVRHFSWELPEGGFQLPDVMCYQKEMASFSVRFGDAFTAPVSAEISGLMNPIGSVQILGSSKGKYAYDAFMSCVVFQPGANCDEAGISRSLSGKWSTDASSGFSAPLTHAFSIVLRNKMEGFSFFATTPVFLIEGRDGSFGRLLLWLLEPYNSGSTVYPLLAKKWLTDPTKRKELLEGVKNILVKGKGQCVTLKDLRSQSQMAFAGEDDLEWDDAVKKVLSAVGLQ